MSAKSNEYCWQYDAIRNGVFTYFLVEGFDGPADSNHDGWVSAEEAFNYAQYWVPKWAKEHGWPEDQHPQIYDGCPGEVPITKV